jgi:hypothetical protein
MPDTTLSPERAAPSGARSFGVLYRALQGNAGDRQALQEMAQLALRVEFSTIPVYLSGMYSIVEKDSLPYQTLRSVVMEEMFHLNLAANLVVALGGLPRFTGAQAPVYPGPMPDGNPDTTPQLGLFRASPQVFDKVFSAIERPAPVGAPPQASHYDSIAQLYAAVVQAIDHFPGNPFEHPAAEGVQRTDIYLGKFGGDVVRVVDKESAHRAITQIVQQGEGVVPANGRPLVPTEPFGAYNHYGQRTDGTYGPIVGTPIEMSHFIKFRHIALSNDPFPATLPITSNPREEAFSSEAARGLSHLFNMAYSAMLHAFELSFRRTEHDPFFGVVLNLMHQALPQLAFALMNTPAHDGGDPAVGPNAAPSWTYLPHARLSDMPAMVAKVQAMGASLPAEVLEALGVVQTSLQNLCKPGLLQSL